jgi:hypothetical protein
MLCVEPSLKGGHGGISTDGERGGDGNRRRGRQASNLVELLRLEVEEEDVGDAALVETVEIVEAMPAVGLIQTGRFNVVKVFKSEN